MHFLLLLLFLSLTSCGIKSKPKPLPEPQFQLKRIGKFVYVIGENLEVPGFQKGKGFWFIQKGEGFCFEVKRIKGKSKKVCVAEAVKYRPELEVQNLKESVKLIPEEQGTFRVYRVLNDMPIPIPIKEFQGEIFLEKDYLKYRVAVTKVLKGYVESEPVFVDIPPKSKPVPEPPYDVGYFQIDGNLVIFWFHKNFEDLIGFNIYRNGKKINKEPLKKNTFVDDYPEKSTVYEIRAINKFGIESRGILVKIKPYVDE